MADMKSYLTLSTAEKVCIWPCPSHTFSIDQRFTKLADDQDRYADNISLSRF